MKLHHYHWLNYQAQELKGMKSSPLSSLSENIESWTSWLPRVRAVACTSRVSPKIFVFHLFQLEVKIYSQLKSAVHWPYMWSKNWQCWEIIVLTVGQTTFWLPKIWTIKNFMSLPIVLFSRYSLFEDKSNQHILICLQLNTHDLIKSRRSRTQGNEQCYNLPQPWIWLYIGFII